jgi:hypothetical protein
MRLYFDGERRQLKEEAGRELKATWLAPAHRVEPERPETARTKTTTLANNT